MNSIRTGVLILEPQTAGHAAEMFPVLSDPAIYEFENSPPESEAWLERRYTQLESRVSPDGKEQWLNWVIRLPSGALAGYVQATITRGVRHISLMSLEANTGARGLAVRQYAPCSKRSRRIAVFVNLQLH